MNNTEWRKVKLGDICTIKTGRLNANAAVENGEYAFFTCSRETFKTDRYSFDGEALLIAGNGDVGFTKYYVGKFDAYQRTYVLMNFSVDAKYIYFYLQKYLPARIEAEMMGSAVPYIKLGTLSDMEIQVPESIEEQRRIASLLSRFDELIQLHEFKADNLIKAKQQIMTDIFSGGLRDLSHINLDDYVQDDWVTVKLGDIFDNISDKNYPDEEVLTIIQGKGTVKRSESGIDIKYKAESLPTYKRVLKNDFIIHLRTHQGGLEIANSTGIVSPAYNIIRCKRASFSYFKHYFRTKEFIFKLQNIAVGLREGKSIKWTDFKNIEVKIPPTIEEQQKIANLLSSYDSLIELKRSQKQQVTNMKQQLMSQLLNNGGGAKQLGNC